MARTPNACFGRKISCAPRYLNVHTVIILHYCDLCGVSGAPNFESARVLLQDCIKRFSILHNRVVQNGDICTATDTRKISKKEINGSIRFSIIIQIL